MAKFGAKKLSIKVPAPKKRLGAAPHVKMPKPKLGQRRVYAKNALAQDPTQYTGVGFGNTGLTGED